MHLNDSPCRGCTERTEYGACHSTCQKYLDYRHEHDIKMKERAIKSEISDFSRDSKKRRTAAFTKLNKRTGKFIKDIEK